MYKISYMHIHSVYLFLGVENERIFPGLEWSCATMSCSVGAGHLPVWLRMTWGLPEVRLLQKKQQSDRQTADRS